VSLSIRTVRLSKKLLGNKSPNLGQNFFLKHSSNNGHLTNCGQKEVQKSFNTIVYQRIADILICPVCQKLENCA
jgi:hypothetical protein